MQTIKPAPNLLVIKKLEKPKTTKSGILLGQDKNALPPNVAEVVSVGSDVKDYSPKDRVVFKQFATTPVDLNGEEYAIIDARDIMGVIQGDTIDN